jgi:hypothetical protein
VRRGFIPDGIGHPAIPASMRLWLDPRQATNPASIPNLAAPGQFITPLGVGPTYSATGMKSRPALVWAGDQERRLQAAIAASFAGNPHMTLISAVNFDTSDSAMVSLETAVSNADASGNNGMSSLLSNVTPPNVASGAVFDGVGATFEADYAAGTILGPVVMTVLVDPGGATVSVRINGVQQATASSAGLSAMTAQAFVAIGGQTDGIDNAFGPVTSQGQLGTVLLFDELLAGAALSSWEKYAGAVSGILF